MITTARPLREELAKHSYTFIAGDEFSIAPELKDGFQAFQADFDHLPADKYLQAGANFRYRRFNFFYFHPAKDELLLMPYRPFFQAAEDNAYAGGIERAFAPLRKSTTQNPFLHELLKFSFWQTPDAADEAKLQDTWEFEVHQVRVISSSEEQGEPSPEGMHRDGGESGFVYLFNRENAKGAISSVYDNNRQLLAEKQLEKPMDAQMFLDPQVMHNVTALEPKDPSKKAVRDVFVFGIFHKPGMEKPEVENG